MSFQPALPPWLIKAVEEAGEATVILKPGDRPFVIKSKAPYHLGTQPMTNLTMEGLAQQILSEDAQETLSRGENVEEILEGSISVNAVRLDHDIVIKLRNAAIKEPEVDEVARQLEEEAQIIKAASAQALRDAAAKAHQASSSSRAEASSDAPRPAFVVQNAAGEAVADIEQSAEEDAVDTFIANLSPAAAPTANAAIETVFDESGSQRAARTTAFARLSKFFNASASASEREEAARGEQEEDRPARAGRSGPPRTGRSGPPRTGREAARRRTRKRRPAANRRMSRGAAGRSARRVEEEAARRAVKDAARQRMQTTEEGDIEPAESTPARATVLELNRRGPLAAATTELTDWILEAMDQGATALYLRADKAPFARIDGQVEILAVEPIPLSMFERAGAMMTAGEDGWQPAGEWSWSKHIPGTGSVHCQAFSDGQGGGFIVQLPVSAAALDEQVPRHIRNACETGEGLIVVSAPFAEDVAAMVGAVVAWSARRRAGHIISFGTNGSLERVAGNAFISDRPLPADDHGMTTALHAALRERPDMLVVIASGPLPAVHALISAAVGRLVIVGMVARTAPLALETLLNQVGSDRHLLAANFKAACSWRGFRTAAERRLVISDTLVATDRVSALIEAGDIAGLHRAQANRDEGMRGVDAALAAAVGRRKISLREAAACAVDRKSLISLVRRQAQERRAAERDEQSALQRASVLRTINSGT